MGVNIYRYSGSRFRAYGAFFLFFLDVSSETNENMIWYLTCARPHGSQPVAMSESHLAIHFQFYSNPFRANSTFRAVKPFAPPLLLTQIANPSGCSSNFSWVSAKAQGQCVGLSTQDRVPGHRYLSQIAITHHPVSLLCSVPL